jgi:hypothetical protein
VAIVPLDDETRSIELSGSGDMAARYLAAARDWQAGQP